MNIGEELNKFIQDLNNKGYIPNKKGIEQIGSQLRNTFSEIGDEGLIPVPTFNREGYGYATAAKALLGPLGKPFRINRNADSDAYLQRQVDLAKRSLDQNNAIKYGHSAGTYEVSPNKRERIASMAIGQWEGQVDPRTGQVIASDNYDFNHSASEYLKAALTGQGFGEQDMSAARRGFYAVAGLGAGLDSIGWLNNKPLGTDYVIGNIQTNPSLLASRNTRPSS